MKYPRMVLAATAILLQSSAAHAAEQWTPLMKVAYVYPHADGFTFLLEGTPLNPGGSCEVNRMIIPASTAEPAGPLTYHDYIRSQDQR